MSAPICDRTDLPPSMCSHCRGLPWNPPVDEAALVEALPGRPPSLVPSGLRAEFESDCPSCGDQIERGDLIVRDPLSKRYVCTECADDRVSR